MKPILRVASISSAVLLALIGCGKKAEAPEVHAQDRHLPVPHQTSHGNQGAVPAKHHHQVG